jgi:hypothetical protein
MTPAALRSDQRRNRYQRCGPGHTFHFGSFQLGPATRSLDKLLHLLATGQVVSLAGEWTIPFFSRPGLAVVAVSDAPPVTIALAWLADDLSPPAARLVDIAREVRAGEGLRALTSARAAGPS